MSFLPFDILVLFGQAGGDQCAVNLASTCQTMKGLMDKRFIVDQRISIREIFTDDYQRRPGLVGNFRDIVAYSLEDVCHLPDDVECVTYEGDEDLSMARWPRDVQSLFFGDTFAHSMEVFPNSLKVIKFGADFNQPIRNVIWPVGLEKLYFGVRFNQSFDGVILPESLLTLDFGDYCDFSQPLDNFTFPANLLNLSIPSKFWSQDLSLIKWPAKIEEVFLSGDELKIAGTVFPDSLKFLTIEYGLHQSIDDVKFAGLVELWLGFDGNIGRLPSSLQALYLYEKFNHPLPPLPDGLKTLKLGDNFNQPVSGFVFPPSLELLEFGFEFNQPLDGICLPHSLKQLSLGECFDQDVRPEWLPGSLQEVELYRPYSETLPLPFQLLMDACGFRFLTQGKNKDNTLYVFTRTLDVIVTIGGDFVQKPTIDLMSYLPGGESEDSDYSGDSEDSEYSGDSEDSE